jgi:hypothetical protein
MENYRLSRHRKLKRTNEQLSTRVDNAYELGLRLSKKINLWTMSNLDRDATLLATLSVNGPKGEVGFTVLATVLTPKANRYASPEPVSFRFLE